jgi:hypothetical protein
MLSHGTQALYGNREQRPAPFLPLKDKYPQDLNPAKIPKVQPHTTRVEQAIFCPACGNTSEAFCECSGCRIPSRIEIDPAPQP